MATKAEKKLAKQLAREALLIQIRKDTLAREGALDEATLKKIKNRWLETVIDTKVPQMQDNLRHILHYMEKLVEAENYRKSLFEEERLELEEKSNSLAQDHASALETLYGIYEKRLKDIHAAYESMNEKKEQAEEEFRIIDEEEKTTQENMQTMLYQMNQNREKKEDMMNCDMFLKLDDERSKNTEIKENLRTKLEKKMEKRWSEISATLNKYEESTKARRKDYITLKIKDDADSKIINQQMKKTQKLFEQLEELKSCVDEGYAPKEVISKIKDTQEERSKFFKILKELKSVLQEELMEDEGNLKTLTAITNAITNELRDICNAGEQILTLYRICLRLETQKEKVLPPAENLILPKFLVQQESLKRVSNHQEQERELSNLMGNWTIDVQVLEKFWQKVGKCRLSKMGLTKFIRDTEKENKVLKQILASYLNEVSEKNLS